MRIGRLILRQLAIALVVLLAFCAERLHANASVCVELLAEIELTRRIARLEEMGRLSPAMAREANRNVLALLERPLASGSAPGISEARAMELFRFLVNHPVAGQGQSATYDPTGCIGFCFGKAYTVHREALRQGIPEDHILKVWAVGTLVDGRGRTWRSHVTTIIKADDGGWWAIDPIIGRPVKVDRWYQLIASNANPSGDVQIRVSSPSRFSADTDADVQASLQNPALSRYMRDLLRSFDESPFRLLPAPSATRPRIITR